MYSGHSLLFSYFSSISVGPFPFCKSLSSIYYFGFVLCFRILLVPSVWLTTRAWLAHWWVCNYASPSPRIWWLPLDQQYIVGHQESLPFLQLTVRRTHLWSQSQCKSIAVSYGCHDVVILGRWMVFCNPFSHLLAIAFFPSSFLCGSPSLKRVV